MTQAPSNDELQVRITGPAVQQIAELARLLNLETQGVLEEALKLLATAVHNGMYTTPVSAHTPAMEAFRLWRTLADMGGASKLQAFTPRGRVMVNLPRDARQAFRPAGAAVPGIKYWEGSR